MLRTTYLAILLLGAGVARCARAGDAPWFYEFEFGYLMPSSDRLLTAACTKVVPAQFVAWYAVDPRPGWEMSCGNRQPVFNHFVGRECFKPLPKLVFHCGWRHFSSPNDREEISYDALSIRGRFAW
jgi:hypothetical protein